MSVVRSEPRIPAFPFFICYVDGGIDATTRRFIGFNSLNSSYKILQGNDHDICMRYGRCALEYGIFVQLCIFGATTINFGKASNYGAREPKIRAKVVLEQYIGTISSR